ncbi:ketoacyl-ACP synthase III family protein [bacterium]|nr:ketoacyl-ACP synthase III family protein [bacterium]
MNFPVIKKSAYALVHTPDMLIHNGTTQSNERSNNPNSDYVKNLESSLRSYAEVVGYAPYQTYIGNMTPEDLASSTRPWYSNYNKSADSQGKFGEILSQDLFYALLQISDVFDLVKLEVNFANAIKEKLVKHDLLSKFSDKIKQGLEKAEIENYLSENAEGLYEKGELVGCVLDAHKSDPNLTSHYMLENLAVKASGVLALLHLIKDLDISEIGYVIECSEEAIGDQNQRGGGNVAKSIAEVVGLNNATGVDLRGFCAAPTHSLVNAASLVQSGIFKNVVILAGGAVAKLGMNGKDHVKKDMPILEDVLGTFAVLVSENDGINPIIRTDSVGIHTVGHGSSPQAVTTALVLDPLAKIGKKIPDINKFCAEMQIPEMTVPAGAGDVPTQNIKMIAALAVKSGQLERSAMPKFVEEHGYQGFAPTQGHIPSGVPIIGHGREHILAGNYENFMVIGKGSLFLGRMTNLFDGISIVIEKNPGLKQKEKKDFNREEIRIMIAQAMKKTAELLTSEQEV